MNLPFSTFRDARSGYICDILFQMPMGSKTYVYFVCNKRCWLGRFEPQEGIGGREVWDYTKLHLMHLWERKPSRKTIIGAIERAESDKPGTWNIETEIEPIAEGTDRLRLSIRDDLDRHLASLV